MNKKFTKTCEYTSPTNCKIHLAVLSNGSNDLFSATDESKNIFIWKKLKEQPIISLTNNSSLITSLILNQSDIELYSGSQTGQIVVWDLESNQVKYNLQGHSTTCTSLALAKINKKPIFLTSASIDGKLKVWDLRMRAATINFKGHSECIRTLSISPDCNYIASGGDDSLVKIWDIGQQKLVKTINIQDQGQINCIEFNPINFSLAYCSNDKTIKHWDLEQQKLICMTPQDKSPFVKIKFDESGKNIYGLTNERFKYIYIDDENSDCLDQIEVGWNKIQDFRYDTNNLTTLNTYGNKIGYWSLPLNQFKDTENIDVDIEDNITTGVSSNNDKVMKNIQKDIKKLNLLENKQDIYKSEKYTTNDRYQQNPDKSRSKEKENYILQNNIVINNINTNNQFNDLNSMVNVGKSLSNEYSDKMDIDSVGPNLSKHKSENKGGYIGGNQGSNKNLNSLNNRSIINMKSHEPMGLDLNEFAKNDNKDNDMAVDQSFQSETINDFELMNDITEQQQTYLGVINKRVKSLKMLLKFWTDDINNAINSLGMMKDISLSEINDFFNSTFVTTIEMNKIPLTIDNVITLMPFSIKLISSKYDSHNKTGICTAFNVLKVFYERITSAKKVILSGGIDMAREDRMKKYDIIIELYEQIYKNSNLIKICKKTTSENAKIAIELYNYVELFIGTCRINEESNKKYS